MWDCNHPESPDCRTPLPSRLREDPLRIPPTSGSPEFTSHDSITLGMMRHGDYMLSDHDLPFSGPFGLTTFIIDFLLSPADLQIQDLRAGAPGISAVSSLPKSQAATSATCSRASTCSRRRPLSRGRLRATLLVPTTSTRSRQMAHRFTFRTSPPQPGSRMSWQ